MGSRDQAPWGVPNSEVWQVQQSVTHLNRNKKPLYQLDLQPEPFFQ